MANAFKPVEAERTEERRSATAKSQPYAALVALLERPETYPDRTSRVSLIETHISSVFITDRFVYKLKKPVRFDFLDFSTLDARRRACEAECELNKRLAPGVYLGVVPVTADDNGRLSLNGRGRAIDWVVKMRRLPENRMLDELIRTGRLSGADGRRLAIWLANYYSRLSPIFVSASNYRQAIENHVRNNLSELLDHRHQLPVELVKRCHAAQLQFLALEPTQFHDRVCDGRIIDGHGDLRPEHICLTDDPVVFDCVEFNDELRHLDVADELAFLAMECDYLGANRLGQEIIDTYQGTSGDYFAIRLERFYRCYRACVRAKVSMLVASQEDGNAHSRGLAYLRLAGRYADQLGAPTAIVVCGLMGSGKTSLATALRDLLGNDYIGTDAIRREMLGASPSPAEFNAGHYTEELRARVYSEMLRRADFSLRQHVSVVLDGTFVTEDERKAVVNLIRAAGAVPLIAHCVCPDAVAMERIEHRASEPGLSEARSELYMQQKSNEEPFAGFDSIDVDTTATLRLQEAAVLDALRGLVGPQTGPWSLR